MKYISELYSDSINNYNNYVANAKQYDSIIADLSLLALFQVSLNTFQGQVFKQVAFLGQDQYCLLTNNKLIVVFKQYLLEIHYLYFKFEHLVID